MQEQENVPPSNEPNLPEQKDIDKQIREKNKEFKVLGKEMKSRKKKRSGIVISDEMTQITEDVVELKETKTEEQDQK